MFLFSVSNSARTAAISDLPLPDSPAIVIMNLLLMKTVRFLEMMTFLIPNF